MKDWKKTLIAPGAPIIEVLKVIGAGGLQIALVVDESQNLLGTVTDGDVRTALLQGASIEEPVGNIMCKSPMVAKADEDPQIILQKMKRVDVLQIPIVDNDGRVVGLEILKELVHTPRRDNLVVIMAGGLGKRLRPLTKDCPKPLLKIGDKPILEMIMENFLNYGFHRFYFSVNYKAEMIENHFGDGSKWGAEIRYLREKKKMGTAGALSLLPERPNSAFFVMNGDLLTKVNFKHLLDFHNDRGVKATMCVREYDLQVPYGVVKAENHRLAGIDEKPVQRFFVNAGIYMFEPSVYEYFLKDAFFDMTTLFEKLLEQREMVAVFPLREYWLDIGHIEDFNRAEGEILKFFPSQSDK